MGHDTVSHFSLGSFFIVLTFSSLQTESQSDNTETLPLVPSSETTSSDASSSSTSDSMSDMGDEKLMWQCQTIRDEDTFIERLHIYHDKCDGFEGCWTAPLGGQRQGVRTPWCMGCHQSHCQVAMLEHILHRVRGGIEQMVTTLTAEYCCSCTLAHVHQRRSFRSIYSSGNVAAHHSLNIILKSYLFIKLSECIERYMLKAKTEVIISCQSFGHL